MYSMKTYLVSNLRIVDCLELLDDECYGLDKVLLDRVPNLTTCPTYVFERRPQIEIQTPIICDLGRLILATLDIMGRMEYLLCQLRVYRNLDRI